MTTLAWINAQTNICENTTLDNRPASEIEIEGYLILDLDAIGGGGIGDIWDGEKLNSPEPVIEASSNQPISTGTQEV
jgi:hypothetical protein